MIFSVSVARRTQVTFPAYQYSVMIFLRVIIALNEHICLQSAPVTIARGSPRKSRLMFLSMKKNRLIFCIRIETNQLLSAHPVLLLAFIGDRIEAVAKSEFTALHRKNVAAVAPFVAPPAHSFEYVLATMHQLLRRKKVK